MQKTLTGIGAVGGWGVWYYSNCYHPELHTSGYSGAAAGCGVIAAACIVCIVWIELHTTKTQEKL